MQLFEKDIGEYWRASKLYFAAYVAGLFLFAFLAPYAGEELAYILLGFFQLAIVLHLGWKSKGLGMRLSQSAFLGIFFGLLTTALSFSLTVLIFAFGAGELTPEFLAEAAFNGLVMNPLLGAALCLLGALAGMYYSRWIRKTPDVDRGAVQAEVRKDLPRAARRRMQK